MLAENKTFVNAKYRPRNPITQQLQQQQQSIYIKTLNFDEITSNRND